MANRSKFLARGVVVAVVAAIACAGATAQVGKSQGVIDINTASDKEIAALPNVTAEIAKTIVDARPFDGILSLNKHLLAQKLTQEQATELYGKAFVQINLNTATKDEIMLIPNAGKKMAREFAEYRPWKSWAQFSKEIGKYVGEKETARLAQYCFIPMNVNKASDEDLLTIPGLKKETLEAVAKGKPWKTVDDFKASLAKSVGDKEAARIVRFVVAE